MHFGKSFVLYIFNLSIQWCTSGQILATTFEMTSGKPPNVLFFFKYIKSLTDLSIVLVFIFFSPFGVGRWAWQQHFFSMVTVKYFWHFFLTCLESWCNMLLCCQLQVRNI